MPDEIMSYRPIPTVRRFHESPAQIRCIVGPVGSGKTTGATWEIVYYLPRFIYQEYGLKNTRWVIVRNTYRELIDTTQKTVFEWFTPSQENKSDETYTFLHGECVVEVMFRSCDRPQDVKKFKSLEVTGYWIDESCEVADEIKLMLKNRIGRYPRKCPVRFGIETTNPPDTDSSTYRDFFKSPLPQHEGFKQPPRENEANLRPGYYNDLVRDYGHNKDWIKRYILGEWGIQTAGKPVYNNFSSDFHVSKTPLIWSGGPLFCGWDNSGNVPACVLLQNPSLMHYQILREYHSERMGIYDFAQYAISERNREFPNAEYTEWGDPAGEAKFSNKHGGFTSNAEMMRELGIVLNSSEQNWDMRRESVEVQLGRMVGGMPGLLIDPSCTRLINGFLGGYCYPDRGSGLMQHYAEKPVKNKYSHIHDALQYVMVALNKNVVLARRKTQADYEPRRAREGVRLGGTKRSNEYDGRYQGISVR